MRPESDATARPPTVAIAVPVYFNERSLAELGDRLVAVRAKLREAGVETQFLFTDDGSGDGSLAELLKLKSRLPNTTIIKHTRNFGAIEALRSTFPHVKADCLVIIAADLQDPPEMITKMVEAWRAGRKFVICRRRSRSDPFFTRLYAGLYYWLVRRFVISDYPVGGYDFSLMDRQIVDHLARMPKNVNFVLFAYWLGFRPAVLEYDRELRRHGQSRWTFRKKLKLFVDTFVGFSIVPIRIIMGVGAAVSLLSFTYGAVMIVGGLLGVVPVPGFATLVVLITFLLGLILVFLGVIAEYLWRILYEVNRMPEAVIDDVYS
jgi:polyisoprenyl-phosphate glycosyltransferase